MSELSGFLDWADRMCERALKKGFVELKPLPAWARRRCGTLNKSGLHLVDFVEREHRGKYGATLRRAAKAKRSVA